MEEQVRKLDSFPAEDGHIESVLVGVQEVKVSFQDWRGRKLVILFRDGEKTPKYRKVEKIHEQF